MNDNLLGLLKGYFNKDVMSAASSFLGEDSNKTASAMSSILPTLLTGVMSKSSTSAGASTIENMLSNPTWDSGLLGNVAGMFSGGSHSEGIMRTGSGIISKIFGDKMGGIVDLITSVSGMRRESSGNLLSMAAPILMGLLGKVKGDRGFNYASLLGLLFSQRNTLKNLIPSGLGKILGFGNLDDLARTAQNNLGSSYNLGLADTTTTRRTTSSTPAPKKNNFLPLLLGALVLGGLLLGWKMCSGDVKKATNTVVETTKDAGKAVVDGAKDAGNAVAEGAGNLADGIEAAWDKSVKALGEMMTISLPNKIKLNVPKLGIEKKLLDFIRDKKMTISKDKWFSMDRILFDTGKASLDKRSNEQIKNIASILKAYPKVHIKIGGYTDNTGDSASNMKLSQARANTVMQALIANGINAKRLSAEGYGEQHPVASNDTAEGRRKNRRIDINITKK